MSDYFNSLKDDDRDRERYEVKLNAIGLQLDKDPYHDEHDYEANMTSGVQTYFAYFYCMTGCYCGNNLMLTTVLQEDGEVNEDWNQKYTVESLC